MSVKYDKILGAVREDDSGGLSSGTVTTVKDEGVNLSTAVTSIDFVGAGVTATGTTAVTVTIPGGAGSPGGSDTTIQFNNASAFGGSDNLTWNTELYNYISGLPETYGGALHANKDTKWSDGGAGFTAMLLSQNDDLYDSTSNPVAFVHNNETVYLIDPGVVLTQDESLHQKFNMSVGTMTATTVVTDTLTIKSLTVSSNPETASDFSVFLNSAASMTQGNNYMPNMRFGSWAWASVLFTDTSEATFTDGLSYVNGQTPVRLLNAVAVNNRTYFGTLPQFTTVSFVVNGTAPTSGAGTWEIYSGGAWTSVGITDTTNGMRQSGTVTVPTIATTLVDGFNAKWLRFTVTTLYNAVPNGQFHIAGTVGTNSTYDEGNVSHLIKATGSTYESTGLTIPSTGVMSGMIAPTHFTGDLVNYGINRDTSGGIFKVNYQGNITSRGTLNLTTTGSSGGIYIGADAQLYRGAANRLDLATGDSFYVVGGGGTFSVGAAPNALYSTYISRTESSLVTSTSQAVRADLTLSAGVNSSSFPTAARFDINGSSGVTNIDYMGGALCNVVITSSQTGGTVANGTGGEFNVRVNSTGAAISAIYGGLFKAGFFSTGATGTISNAMGGLFAASHVDSAGSCTTNIAARFETRAPLGGITTNYHLEVRTPSAAAGRVITTNYGIYINTQTTTGVTTGYGLYFAGTSATAADGITMRNGSILLYPVAADILGLGSGDSLQFDAGNIITDTTTGAKIGTGTTQKLGFWNATPVVQNTGWTTSNVSSDKVLNANATTIDELADVLGTLIDTLKTYGILGA